MTFKQKEQELMDAIIKTDLEAIKQLIHEDVDVNCHDEIDCPLSLAFKNFDIVKLLLEADADPNLILTSKSGSKSVLSDLAFYIVTDLLKNPNFTKEPWLRTINYLVLVGVDFTEPLITYRDGIIKFEDLIRNKYLIHIKYNYESWIYYKEIIKDIQKIIYL